MESSAADEGATGQVDVVIMNGGAVVTRTRVQEANLDWRIVGSWLYSHP